MEERLVIYGKFAILTALLLQEDCRPGGLRHPQPQPGPPSESQAWAAAPKRALGLSATLVPAQQPPQAPANQPWSDFGLRWPRLSKGQGEAACEEGKLRRSSLKIACREAFFVAPSKLGSD